MNTAQTAGAFASARIKSLMTEKRVSRKALYDRANITRDTFDRRMASGQGWTIDELTAIASVLGVPALDLLPAQMDQAVAA